MPPVNALLYALCSALLLGMAALILLRDPRSRLHRAFACTGLFLLAWVATLFLFTKAADPTKVLLLGRLNFAAVPPAVYSGYLFVRAVAGLPPQGRGKAFAGAGTAALLALVSGLTPAVDRAELPAGTQAAAGAARHVTVYGPLFPLYALYAFGYLAASVSLALRVRAWRRTPQAARDQLLLVGGGVLATGAVSLVTNALLPFSFGDFRFIDAGPLSTLLFLLAVAYATLRHHLFDLKLFVRKTVVYGLLLSFVLAAYSATLVLVSDRIAGQSRGAVTRFGVLVIAFSFDPVRRFLENRVDRLLFRRERRDRRDRFHRPDARKRSDLSGRRGASAPDAAATRRSH